MKSDEYFVREFESGDLNQVIDLLSLLWGKDSQKRHENFSWKYQHNPYTNKPLGIVTIHKNNVVGFRGYMASEWINKSQNVKFNILAPGDTCVSLDHRRKGLSVRMGRLAMEVFSSDFKLFLNTTCTPNSLPGYQKMGFFPLTKKVFFSTYNIFALFHYLCTYRKRYEYNILKGSDKIYISNQPRPEEMAEIAALHIGNDEKIQLHRDIRFYQWRFNNPLARYKFFYLGEPGNTCAFAAVGLAERGRRAYILDYGYKEPDALNKIFKFILESKTFNLLSVYHFSIDNTLSFLFNNLGFKQKGLLRLIEKKKLKDLPLLIRPVISNFKEQDWYIGKLDLRIMQNWFILAIASDAA